MATVADLKAKVGIEGVEKSVSDLKSVDKHVSGLTDSFKKGLAGATGFLTGLAGLSLVQDALGAVKDQLIGMFQATIDDQKIMGQIGAVIKSTGGAAGVSAQQINDMANAIEAQTGIDDAAVKSAEAMLLTFTNVGKTTFPQATQAIADMATAMNGGAIPTAEQLRQTAIQVGKALNDPINGVQTLQRVGVKLSEAQKEQVKHFMAVGDSASAQKVILGELNKEFGGSAEAAGKTLPGQLARLQNSLQDTGKGILQGLMPTLSDLLEHHILPLADQFGKWLPGALAQAGKSLGELWTNIGPVAGAIKDFAVNAWGKLQDALKDPAVQQQMGTFGTVMGNIGDAIGKAMPGILDFAKTTGKDLLDAFQKASPKIEEARQAFADFSTEVIDKVGPIVKEWWPKLQKGLEDFATVWNAAWPGIQATLETVWGVIQGVVETAWNIVSGIIKVGLDILGGNWGQAWEDMKKALEGAWHGIQKIGESLFGKLRDTIVQKATELKDNVVAKFNELKDNIGTALQELPGKLKDLGKQMIDNLVQALKDGAGRVSSAAGNLLSGIHVPGFAQGTSDAPGGVAYVHKDELVYLPQHSVVKTAAQTRQILSGGGGGNGSGGGNSYITNVYPQQAHIDTAELARIQRRRELLVGMR